MTNETTSQQKISEEFWGKLVVQYWYFVLIFGLIIIADIIGFILTVDTYISNSTIGGQGTWTFDQFSIGTALEFMIIFFLWIVVIIALPTLAVGAILVALIWFVVFSSELREEMKSQFKKDEERQKRFGRKSEGGGAFGFLMFVGVCIYIYIDGNWLTEFGSLNFRYFVDAWITVFLYGIIIFGIPATIIGIMWFVRKYRK